MASLITRADPVGRDINIYEGKKGAVTKFSTSGVDGRVIIWDARGL